MIDDRFINSFVKNISKNQNEVPTSLDDDFLEHHGVDNQKWGVRRGPPYPLNSEAKKKDPSKMQKNTLSGTAKKQAGKTTRKAAEKTRKKMESEKRKEEKQKENYEKNKERYAKSPKQLYKHRAMYTKEEIQKALDGFDWGNKIKSYQDADMKRAKETVNTFKEFANSIASIAESGVKIYNVVAKVHNVADPNDNKWVLIPANEKKDEKQQKGENK